MSTIIQKEIVQIVNCSFCILMQNSMCVVEGKGWGGEGGGWHLRLSIVKGGGGGENCQQEFRVFRLTLC